MSPKACSCAAATAASRSLPVVEGNLSFPRILIVALFLVEEVLSLDSFIGEEGNGMFG